MDLLNWNKNTLFFERFIDTLLTHIERPRNLQRSPILREPKDIRQELLVVLKHAYDVRDPLPSIGVQPQPEA